jgi:hypothetical protein
MLLNLRTIPARLGSSSVAIIGIAGVVVVFVSVLSISAGFNAAMTGSGSPGRAIVLRAGSDTELTSAVDGVEAGIIKQAPGIAKDGDITLASADLFVVLDLPRKGVQDSSSNVPMRGIEAVAMQVEDGHFHRGRPDVSVWNERSHRWTLCQSSVRQPEPGRYDRFRTESMAGRWDLRSGRWASRNRNLDRMCIRCKASIAGRTPSPQSM